MKEKGRKMENYWDAFWETWNSMRRPDDPMGGPELLKAYHNHLLSERFLPPDEAAVLRENIRKRERVIRSLGAQIASITENLAPA